jgi:hypothetical protein
MYYGERDETNPAPTPLTEILHCQGEIVEENFSHEECIIL